MPEMMFQIGDISLYKCPLGLYWHKDDKIGNGMN